MASPILDNTDTFTRPDPTRTSTNVSIASSRIRAASIKLMEARPPPGMWAATATSASKAPTLADIRRGSFGSEGWNEESQRQRAGSRTSQGDDRRMLRRTSSNKVASPSEDTYGSLAQNARATGSEPFPQVTEERASYEATNKVIQYDGQDHDIVSDVEPKQNSMTTERTGDDASRQPLRHSEEYANGYVPPPKLPWTRSFMIGLNGFWKWFLTPSGFLITLYGLNVVAWGGMLFLLLCNAAPAMCTPSCDHIDSPRRKWVEYDSQILNALFCVTGFGLAPWRFRDLYWWTLWRIGGAERKQVGIRRLAGIHRGWYRLPGSNQLPEDANATNVDPEDPAVPIPVKTIPDPPPTGFRAPPTKNWKVDFVLWMNAWNTFFQVVLCFYMWHYDRIERPSWATGLFVALGCGVAGAGGIMMWQEGKKIKKVEGVPMEGRPTDVEARQSQNIPLVSVVAEKAKR